MKNIKVFKLNDCDWYAGETIDHAKEALIDDLSEHDNPDKEQFFFEPKELTQKQMETLIVRDDGDEIEYTFAEHLRARLEGGSIPPFAFASTEN